MAFTCDPTTRAELNAAPNKLAWAAALNAALGNTRRIRCKRDPNGNATDPWATGVEFRNVGSTGAFKTVAGRVVGLGRIKGTTIALPADMSTGKSVLRIEGNGRWIQGTLGLAGNTPPYDFAVRGSFTATNGLAVTADFALSGGRFLPSGTGTPAPPKVATAPHRFELYDWANPASPVLVQATVLDTRDDDYVFQDTEMASNMGDVAWYRCNQSLIWGNYEFAPHLLLADQSLTEAGNVPLYQAMIANAYRGTWYSYPDQTNFDKQNHLMQPGPFKILMKDQNGTLLHTFEMHDGLPINDPSIHSDHMTIPGDLNSRQRRDATHPVRPKYNTMMMLPWQNTRPKMSSIATKIYPGMATPNYRPSMAKGHYAVLGCEPVITDGYDRNGSINGLMDMWAVPQWPLPITNYVPAVLDPYLNNGEFNAPGHSAYAAPWAVGWDYEPGSFSQHNWYTAPGGPRFDRAVIPSTFAMWMTYPNGNRLQENTAWRDIIHGFSFGYFNHSNKWFNDPKTMTLFTKKILLEGGAQITGNYYGDAGVPPGGLAIQMNSMRGGNGPSNYDANGDLVISGWARDSLHGYCNAGWAAMLLNSPMHAIISRLDTVTSFLFTGPPGGNPRGDYMVRTQAWEWMHYPIAWKLAADHSLSFTQADIEKRFLLRLEDYWQNIYKPTFLDNSQDIFCQCLRNLGVPFWETNGYYSMNGGHLGFYMGHVLQLMKQTGFWHAIYSRGGHAKDVLDMQLRNMDKYCFDTILDTCAINYGGYQSFGLADFGGNVPASWAAYEARYPAQTFTYGSDGNGNPLYYPAGTTLYNNANGTSRGGSALDVSDHLYAQYPFIRRDYFPEIASARVTAACAKFDAYEQNLATYVASRPTPFAQMDADFTNRYPALVRIAAPTALGPA